MPKGDIKKVVLAYSGGLDTSIILKWLQTDLRLRGGDLHRRPRPGRGAGAGAQEGAAARHQAEEHLHRGPARGIRPRLRVPDVPRQRALRGAVPARHLDRAAADRQAADRDRAKRSAPTRWRTARPARATTRCASSSPITRSTRRSRSSRPGANGTSRSREELIDVRRAAPDSDRQGQARRGAVLGRRQPAALLLGGQGAGGPGEGGAGLCLSAHRRRRWRRPTRRPRYASDFERGDAVSARRQEAVAGRAAHRAERARQAPTASAASTWSRTVSSA